MARIFILEDDKSKSEKETGINSTIKPIDREDSNAEIESGELVLNPDMGGLWTSLGKKHSKGGTPVRLRNGAFVFSNDKSLAISHEEKELFEIDDPMEKAKDNTPAALLKRIVKPKDYNSLVEMLNEGNRDEIEKQSATLMLQKYMEKIGQIGFLQEAKKGEPAPDFSMGTAPIYDENLNERLQENKQFMKFGGYFQAGGRFRNPFDLLSSDNLRKLGLTGQPYKDYIYGRNSQRQNVSQTVVQSPVQLTMPRDTQVPAQLIMPPDTPASMRTRPSDTTTITPQNSTPVQEGITAWPGDKTTGVPNASKYSTEQWREFAKRLGFTGNNNLDFQKFLADHPNPKIRETVQRLHNDLGTPYGGMFDSKLGYRWDIVFDELQNEPPVDVTTLRPGIGNVPKPQVNTTTETIKQSVAPSAGPKPNDFRQSNVTPYNPNVPLSPLQNLNLLYAANQALTVPKFFPMRPQIQSPLVELERLNAQPYLNQVDNATYQAYAANRTLNPTLQAANNAAVFGKALDAKSQALGNVLNQNVQIGNQQNLMNNQIQRQDQAANIQFNQQYYDNLQRMNQNYSDETRAARNVAFGLFNQYRSENDALEAKLMSQRLFTKPVLDSKGNQVVDENGNPRYQQAPLFDINTRGWSPRVYYTGAGDISQVPARPDTSGLFDSTFQKLISQGVPANTAAIVAGRLAGDKEALQYSVQTQFKYGGKVKRMRKK